MFVASSKHISEIKVTEAIDPKKDVDGFHPVNLGRMTLNLPTFLPATPAGIVELLDRYNIETSGKHCVVIGRSHIVGSPMSILMARNAKIGNCTVTLTHSRTTNLEEITRSADILIVALGKAEFVTASMVKEGAVIVDVGITRVKSDKTKSGLETKGDVAFDEVAPKCSFITPGSWWCRTNDNCFTLKEYLNFCSKRDQIFLNNFKIGNYILLYLGFYSALKI